MPINWDIDGIIKIDEEHVLAKGTHKQFKQSTLSSLYNKANRQKTHHWSIPIEAELNDYYQIGNSFYNQLYVFQVLEETTGKQILTKDQKRPLKKLWNTIIQIEFKQAKLDNVYGITVVFIKGHRSNMIWAIAPKWKDD